MDQRIDTYREWTGTSKKDFTSDDRQHTQHLLNGMDALHMQCRVLATMTMDHDWSAFSKEMGTLNRILTYIKNMTMDVDFTPSEQDIQSIQQVISTLQSPKHKHVVLSKPLKPRPVARPKSTRKRKRPSKNSC
jgi:hypothetical protein